MIEVRNVNKTFNKKQILFDVSAKFEAGQTNLIIGQSGHGKTVLLKSIVGLHSIDSGEIIYGNKVFSGMSFTDQKEIRQQIGMLFQGSALFDSLTVEENVKFPLDMFSNKSTEEKLDRVNFCLNRVNLENVNHLYPSEISGGMQKRVAIARAIALNPKYLFCDEPNSGLDPKTSIVIDNLIYEITKEYGITTIMNTHDMNSVMAIGEKIIYIHSGRKLWEGNKEDILVAKEKELNDFVFASELFKRIKRNV
ncbi:ABC transporter ATP-binding protein [Plebeiibacterium sediminum]|uniref:ATP-binding cassette domain-containing protein n=1 Tax=Plebeiibacterium sediminum TaxID=2992112 RepID=A0AAE3SGL1_9BACT|nr:ATP-binding cassette domain-containing protein [Plebeiobacterium sediminum]MCW3788610.1 ATP-binding cassette domain-containing protein [Plebeiobacterium sediminum]